VPLGKTVFFQAFGYTIIVRMQRKEPNKDWLQSHPKLKIFDVGVSRSKKISLTEWTAGLYHEFGHIAVNVEKIKRKKRCGCGDYQDEIVAWALAMEMMEQNGIDVERCLPNIGNALLSYANEEQFKVAVGSTLNALGKWKAPLVKHIRKQWLQKHSVGRK
jgi:hypothetical protein